MKNTLAVAIIFLILSCDKKTLNWNLSKKPESLIKTIDCSSLTGLNTLYIYWNGFGDANAQWVIDNNGYVGSCIIADNPNLNGLGAKYAHVEFTENFDTEGFIKCWTISLGPQIINGPKVYVDDSLLCEMTQCGGSNKSNEWIQNKSILILPGNHKIKIELENTSNPKLDEIEIWELK